MKISGDGTVTMTFDEYDWYPDMSSAQKLISQFTDNVLFVIWILYSPLARELTEKERQVRGFLNRELNHRLNLVG